MIAWSSPAWLLALGSLPLVWWLHRFKSPDPAITVSSLLIWKTAAAPLDSGMRGKKTDRLWLLRASIASLLILAIAAPYWTDAAHGSIHIWLDDSFSMQTKEHGRGRAELAFEKALPQLASAGATRVTLHSLGDAGRSPLILEAESKNSWPSQFKRWLKIGDNGELSLPNETHFPGTERHWLITDGADRAINDWLPTMPIEHLLTVGRETENSALTLLSMRPGLRHPAVWNGLIKLRHFGLQPDQRNLELVLGDKRLRRWSVTLQPEAVIHLDFEVDLQGIEKPRLLVRFDSADALAQDDQIILNPDVSHAVEILGQCPPALQAALQAHPFLNLSPATAETASLTIACGNTNVAERNNTIRFHTADAYQPLHVDPVWLTAPEELQQLYLQRNWLGFVAPPHPRPTGQPLLIAGDAQLMTVAESPKRIVDCYLDMNHPDFIRRPEYPALVSGIIDLALNRPVLDNVSSVERTAEQSRIMPLPMRLSESRHQPYKQDSIVDLAPYLIFAAIMLCLTDAWLAINKRSPGKGAP